MAGSYYEGLPIYKTAMDLVVRLETVVRGFSRFHKYTLGSRLRGEALEIVLLVARANQREYRAQVIPLLCKRIEDVKILVNVGREVEAFQSFNQFAQVMEQVVALARQAEGWRKSLPRQSAPEPKPVGPKQVRP